MSQHNLWNVVRFEVVRTLRKPIFWVITLGVPVLFAALAGLSVLSSMSAPGSIEEANKATKSFVYVDDSGLVNPEVAKARGGRQVSDIDAARLDVQHGRESMFVHFPANPLKQPTTVYGADLGLIRNSVYGDVAQEVLTQSATKAIGNDQLAKLVGGAGETKTVTFADGQLSGGLAEFLPPMAFLVLFFMTVVMLGNQMLNITVEEKENRVTEMILTTIGPNTLITGKAIGVVLIGLVQTAVFTVPSLIVGVVAVTTLNAADVIQLSPVRLLVGLLLYLFGFLMFTGLLICLGSLMPSAKEAGGAFGAVIMVMFLPLYAVTLILSSPDAVVARVLTYFPLTAPMTAMLRNAAGSLSPVSTLVVLAIVGVTAAVLLRLGAQLFARGSLEYDRRLNPLALLRRPSRVKAQPGEG